MSSGILIDSCIIIDHWRTSYQDRSILSQIKRQYDDIYISVITEYEILNGMTELFQKYWDEYVKRLIILPVDSHVVRCASRIRTQLKMKRKTVDLADILIAATTLAHDIHFATINQKHFENIDGLKFAPLKYPDID